MSSNHVRSVRFAEFAHALLSHLLVCCFLLLFGTGICTSQSSTTALRGGVFDEKGAVVQGAAVSIIDANTGFTRSTITNAQGEYQFPQIPPATYVLSASAPGFANIKHTDIKLLVDTPATVNLTLRVAAENVTI